MDTSDLVIDCTAQDFEQAIRHLLPQGQYWQESTNVELNNVIAGMAIDFKITHDEIQLALLSDFSESLFGWKIADYQSLLNQSTTGLVFDDKAQPNLIMVALVANSRSETAFYDFERVRLPHTEIQWIAKTLATEYVQAANAHHIRNITKHEVTS
ncbi:hypothetical protein [Vibrio litoralis]|uniref:hypothetical protein n=1 Tax=Vibrio litoralis TaxID=335972 RepID=UPI000425B76D|nr:hypothetical protein [Vibrio litoralis]